MRGSGRTLPLFVLVTSAIVMATVLLAQYWGGLAACELCLTERWPWDVAIVIAFVATLVGSRPALPWVALSLAAVFVVGSALGFYHFGVEQHWFAGPSACADTGTPTTLVELKAQLMRQQPVRCDEPAWTFLGISLAGWNLMASLVMAGICIAGFLDTRRRGRR